MQKITRTASNAILAAGKLATKSSASIFLKIATGNEREVKQNAIKAGCQKS
jgi:hypothetical protein